MLPAVTRLAEIPGLTENSAAALIAEIGLDMSIFPTPEALVSWAGLAPVPNQSGPRKSRGKKGTVQLRPPHRRRPPTAPPARPRSSASGTAGSAPAPAADGTKPAAPSAGRSS